MADNGTLALWSKLKAMVDAQIEKRTRECCRMKSMVVATAYDPAKKTVGVREAFGRIIDVPVFSGLDAGKLVKGTAVWVIILGGSMSNAMAFMLGNGSGATGGAGDSASRVLTFSLPASGWTGSGPYTCAISDGRTTEQTAVVECVLTEATRANQLTDIEWTTSAGSIVLSTLVKPVGELAGYMILTDVQ